MHVRPLSIIASLGLLLLTSCDSKRKFDTYTGKLSLQASAQPFATGSHSYPANTTYWPCPFNPRATGADTPTPGFQSVGYEHAFEAGTPPAPCQWRLNHVHRLVALFDLSPFEREGLIPKNATALMVDSAILRFDKRHAAGARECTDRILSVSGPGPEPGSAIRPASSDKWDTEVPKLGSCPGGRCEVNVTGQVNDWVRKVVTPNQGFLFRGEDERLNANDNVSCRNEYANFQLDVAYRYDVPAGSIPIIKPLPAITLSVKLETVLPKEVVYKLVWTGTSGDQVDIYRDGIKINTVADDGSEFDTTGPSVPKYKVCNKDTTTCSIEVPGKP